MYEHRLLRRAMLISVGDERKKVRGGKTIPWHQSLKSLTSSVIHIDRFRLLGLDPRDYHNQWLETV
ncbi:unnamed protein product [Schistosoma curassoni]|uniref:Uncharacterized protein n=1 Tax=Schistosoma curassoni TaxID=6186 RepID=A0A183K6C8_9TREM|nr:unnamed protein product [Schistosoma curassoni]